MSEINKISMKKFSWPKITIASYIISLFFIGLGFFKLCIYVSGDSYATPINAAVGGDAFNYIINSTSAVAYFVLALILVVFGSVVAIIRAITEK